MLNRLKEIVSSTRKEREGALKEKEERNLLQQKLREALSVKEDATIVIRARARELEDLKMELDATKSLLQNEKTKLEALRRTSASKEGKRKEV